MAIYRLYYYSGGSKDFEGDSYSDIVKRERIKPGTVRRVTKVNREKIER